MIYRNVQFEDACRADALPTTYFNISELDVSFSCSYWFEVPSTSIWSSKCVTSHHETRAITLHLYSEKLLYIFII